MSRCLVLGETHKLIAENIARELHLDEKYKDLLIEGSIAPDTLRDFPHHVGKEGEIVSHLANAIKLFHEKNDECYVELGKALHYIQDRWVSRPGSLHAHSEWERRINESSILNGEALIQHIEAHPFPSEVKEYYKKLVNKISAGVGSVSLLEYDTLRRIYHVWTSSELFAKTCYFALAWSHPKSVSDEPYSTPTIDLNIAYMICLQIAHCVLSSSSTDWEKNALSISELEAARAKLKEMERWNGLWILGRLLYTYIKSIILLPVTNLLFYGFATLVLYVIGTNLPKDKSAWGLDMFALIFGPFFILIFIYIFAWFVIGNTNFHWNVIGEGRNFKFTKDFLAPGLASAFAVQILYYFHPYGLHCYAVHHYLLVPAYFVVTRLRIIRQSLVSLRKRVPRLEEEILKRLEEETRQGITTL